MKELIEGRISTKELADWFGIAYETFKHSSAKKYEILSEYCEFEKVHGGIIVKTVYIPIYSKQINPKNCAYVINKIFNKDSKINSARGLSQLAQIDIFSHYSDNQSYYRIKQILDLLFGHFTKKSLKSKGLVGERVKIWAVKLNTSRPNEYRFFTDEEDKAFRELTKKCFAKDDEVDIFLNTMLLDDTESKGEWVEDFNEKVIQTLKEEYGIQAVKVQIYDFIKSVDLTKQEIQYLQTITNEAKRLGWEIPDLF